MHQYELIFTIVMHLTCMFVINITSPPITTYTSLISRFCVHYVDYIFHITEQTYSNYASPSYKAKETFFIEMGHYKITPDFLKALADDLFSFRCPLRWNDKALVFKIVHSLKLSCDWVCLLMMQMISLLSMSFSFVPENVWSNIIHYFLHYFLFPMPVY